MHTAWQYTYFGFIVPKYWIVLVMISILQPSSTPSESASQIPSSMPSETPSSEPSHNPSVSGSPTIQASMNPSSSPSTSASPTARITSPPTNTKPTTQAPTAPPPKFYPDFPNSVCTNDGNEDAYMTDNPEEYLFENIEECCSRWYSWDKENCYALDSSYVDPTDTLYYPDWSQEICTNDGNAPAYIRAKPSFWMFGMFICKCQMSACIFL